jgi:hypothetical protein
VLQAEIFLVEMSAEAQPFFEIAGGFDYVHAGNDSDGWKKKSNEAWAQCGGRENKTRG